MNRCNIKKDCDDWTDEICENIDYKSLTDKCTLEYSTNGEMLSNVHYPYLSIFNCSLEKCKNGYFLCSYYKFCISLELVCDGINHCLRNEDEFLCGIRKIYILRIFFFFVLS